MAVVANAESVKTSQPTDGAFHHLCLVFSQEPSPVRFHGQCFVAECGG